MILWMIKLIGFVRKAIAGRRYPSQLAWAVAFGLLLGIVPHGNLLAVALLIVVLSLKLNHAMAMLTAVGATFLAVKLDPVSHAVGDYLYSQPKFAEVATKAWALPMMPWTDLNNTVVLGSFTIGLLALIPVFMVTYPFFRLFAPKAEVDVEDSEDQRSIRKLQGDKSQGDSGEQMIYVDRGSSQVPAPHKESSPSVQPTANQSGSRIDFVEVSPVASSPSPAQRSKESVETRIDVIRVKEPGGPDQASQSGMPQVGQPDPSRVSHPDATPSQTSPSPNQPPQPMDEALNYLLRQLRDSQQRNAA